LISSVKITEYPGIVDFLLLITRPHFSFPKASEKFGKFCYILNLQGR
jgi:hypothetical protein